jgi:hypothetical protein
MKFYLNKVNSFKVKKFGSADTNKYYAYVSLCEISLRCANLLLVGTVHRNTSQLLGGCR